MMINDAMMAKTTRCVDIQGYGMANGYVSNVIRDHSKYFGDHLPWSRYWQRNAYCGLTTGWLL